MRLQSGWIRDVKWSVFGESASSTNDWRAWRNEPAQVAPGPFPPELVVEIKALACELPANMGLPLSRLSVADVARQAERSGLVAHISDSTVWRWLHEDAIRPWQHRCWIFPRDPQFQAKAGRILDLYARSWQGRALREDEFVVSTDEKTSIQARVRTHPSLPVSLGKPMRVEHEYRRAALGPIWRRSMYTGRRCSGVARQRPASHHSVGWSIRSWASLPTTKRAPCSGSWTTDRRIVASARYGD